VGQLTSANQTTSEAALRFLGIRDDLDKILGTLREAQKPVLRGLAERIEALQVRLSALLAKAQALDVVTLRWWARDTARDDEGIHLALLRHANQRIRDGGK